VSWYKALLGGVVGGVVGGAVGTIYWCGVLADVS